MDYGYALSRAWKITWKYKIVWIFGVLATYVQAVWPLFYLQITEQTPEITKEDTIVEYA